MKPLPRSRRRLGAPAVLLAVCAFGPGRPAHAAATQSEFDAAYAAAVAAEQQAGSLRNQWTVTEDELKAAKTAADAKDYEAAVASAQRAGALAKRSVAQAMEQDQHWTGAVLR